jgi:hypothetical protein
MPRPAASSSSSPRRERQLDVFYDPFACARGIELLGERRLAGVAIDVLSRTGKEPPAMNIGAQRLATKNRTWPLMPALTAAMQRERGYRRG